MRKLTRMIAGFASVAAAAALVAGTVTMASAATNDPPKSVTPAAYDVVGVGSDTTEYVMDAFSVGYNKTVKVHNANNPYFYSYDALPLGKNTPSTTYTIKPKAGCATIARPDGSSAGITALGESQPIKYKGGSYQCLNFARSSRARKSTDPADKAAGSVFVTFAKDAITWAARSAAAGGTNAPASLTTKQLKAIFSCSPSARNWDQVGGKHGAIQVYLPQVGSGTLSTWETDMGISTRRHLRQPGARGERGHVPRLRLQERDLHLVDRRLRRAEVPLRGLHQDADQVAEPVRLQPDRLHRPREDQRR